MPANLYLAPVGADKIATVVASLRAALGRGGQTLPSVWVLTANRRQQLSFRGQLLSRYPQDQTFFNIEFFSFYTLYERLLNLAAQPARKIATATQLALLRSLAERMQAERQLRYFQQIAQTRGFIEILADLINELKQNRVDDEKFAQEAISDKDRDLAALYQLYQKTLKEQNLVDIEGEGWLALATLRDKPHIVGAVQRVIVDGFDQYTLVQARLLAQLARAAPQVDITLTALPAASQAFSRRSPLARQRLEDAFDELGIKLQVETLAEKDSERHEDLWRLGQLLFQNKAAKPRSAAIRLLAMPSEAEETRAVLRAAKAQLHAGARADDIMIALRDWDRYAAYFRQAQAEYKLPLLLHNQPLLHTVPVIAALIDLLELSPHFRRIELLDVLRSPYFDTGLSAQDVDLLDRLSRERLFLRGSKADWVQMVKLAAQHPWIDDEDIDEDAVLDISERTESLAGKLARFLDGIKPPEKATVEDYIDWLDRLLGPEPELEELEEPAEAPGEFSLGISELASDAARASDDIAQRDRDALQSLHKIQDSMLVCGQILAQELAQSSEIAWARFWSDLKYALQTTSGQASGSARNGRVLVSTATEARGLPQAHVYVMGLSEGLFPAETGDDPIYLDSERERLRARGIHLSTQAERADDRGLFVELISLPRQSLTLSRPAYKDGKPWLESTLWSAALQAFPETPIEGADIGKVAPPEKAASQAELLLAMADLHANRPGMFKKNEGAWRAWLASQPEQARLWRQIRRGQKTELSRLSNYHAFDEYSGRLSRPFALETVKKMLGPRRVWSASQFKDYGACGFRFFAKRLLKLEEIAEPEAGYDSLQLGLLNHDILEETYFEIGAKELAIQPANLPQALEIFEKVAKEKLDSAPQKFGFVAPASWSAEKAMLLKRLRALIKKDFSAKSPLNRLGAERQVYSVEYKFTRQKIFFPELGEALLVSGQIDRIDESDRQMILVDYKTGSGKIARKEMIDGRDFQMMTYVMAMQADQQASAEHAKLKHSLFWHLRSLESSGELDLDNAEHLDAIVGARAHVAANVNAARAGSFPVRPNNEGGKCARYCEFARLCRFSVTNREKPQSHHGA